MKRFIALMLSVIMFSSCFEGMGTVSAAEKVSVVEAEEQITENEPVENVSDTTAQDTSEEKETEQQTEEVYTLEGCSIHLSQTKYVYTGKAISPSVQIVDSLGEEVASENYKISYENNVNIGTAIVIVSGTGAYTGEVRTTFEIIAFDSQMPTIATTPAYGKIKVEWKTVENADGYQVYRKTSNGTYKRIKTIESGSTIQYTDTDVKIGTTYTYKVRAYRSVNGKTYYSEYTKEKTQKSMVGTPEITSVLRSNYKTIKLNWSAVTGASGYKIYRSTSKDSGYTRIKTVYGKNTLSYSDTTCKCGVTYYYKVCAFRTVNSVKQNGKKSEAVEKRTQPTKVNFTSSTTPTYTTVTLKWKRSIAAQGYEIYRSTSKSSGYELIKTITSGSKLTYKDTGLTKHQVYYYKIRPYTVVNGKYIYGSYSDVYSKPQSGWIYKNGYKLYYNAKGNLVKDVRSIIGEQDEYLIKVNKQRNTVTIYAKDSETGKFIVPVVAFICSAGKPTPIGTFSITEKYRWKWLIGPSWGQWSCRYKGGKLFHSVYYLRENDPYSLGVSAYNDLGTLSSHGCVRLTARDAKWIYDNCAVGTKVQIYNSATSGPFGKPTAYKLPSWHTWDPTDPNVKWKCKKYGCH